MKRAAQNAKASSSMQEVIDVSDDEPTEKSLKREPVPPPPTPELIELRQQIAKMDENLQGAYRLARKWELEKEKAEKRIAQLEDILEKKPKVADEDTKKANDELKKKFDSLTKQLEDERSRANEDRKRIGGLRSDNEELKQAKIDNVKYLSRIDVLTQQRDAFESESLQLKSRLADTLTKLEKARDSKDQFSKNALKMGQEAIAHAVDVKEWKRKKAEVETEKEQLQQQNKELIKELQDMVHKRMLEKARADNVTQEFEAFKAAQLQLQLQKQQQPVQPQAVQPQQTPTPSLPPSSPQAPAKATSSKKKKVATTTTRRPSNVASTSAARVDQLSTNLFELLNANSIDSVPLSDAVDRLKAKYNSKDKFWNKKYKANVKNEKSFCDSCNKEFEKGWLLPHFFSKAHSLKVKNATAVISLDAVEYWEKKLVMISQVVADVTSGEDGMSDTSAVTDYDEDRSET